MWGKTLQKINSNKDFQNYLHLYRRLYFKQNKIYQKQGNRLKYLIIILREIMGKTIRKDVSKPFIRRIHYIYNTGN